MEGSGKGGSSSISSQLFGNSNKVSSSSSSSVNANSSSSLGVFDSVFSTSSTYPGRDSSRSQFGSWRKQESEHQGWSSKQGSSGNTHQSKDEGQTVPNEDRSSIFLTETVEQPCYLSSSLYYGGQDMYSNPSNAQISTTSQIFKKDGGGEDDPNGSNSNSASRGNWWQGSLYY